MKKIALAALLLVGMIGLLTYSGSSSKHEKIIGIVVPVEHQAMTDMTNGFTEVVENQYGSHVKIDIQNAHGDGGIQHALIENFKRKHYDLIVTIGTDVTLMAQNIVKQQPILGLDVTELVKQNQKNITGVLESPIEPSYQFIKELIPHLKKVTMVYSASDKNYEMTRKFKELAAADNVAVQPIMIQSLADLYVLAGTVEMGSDAIFIAKDHLVASGASSLAQTAKYLKIPLITSDEGSVKAGGAIALGNKEINIGRRGGEIALQLLGGKAPSEIPIKPIDTHTVFLNTKAAKKQGLDLQYVDSAAQLLNSSIEVVRKEKQS